MKTHSVAMIAALLAICLTATAAAVAPQPEIEFVRTFGGITAEDAVARLAVSADGTVYAGGAAHGPTLLGQPTAGAADVFVAKFGPGGKFAWARLLKGTADDFLLGLAAGPDNSVYATGYSVSPVFEGVPNRGDYDAFVAKFDSAGNRVWLKMLGGAGNDVGQDIVVSPSGNAIVAGTTGGPSFQKLPTDGRDGFIAWFKPDGTRQRLKLVQGPADEYVTGMALLADRSVVVAGSTRDEGDPNGDADPFVARFSPGGRPIWQRATPLAAREWVNDLVVTGGGIYLVGYEESPDSETAPDVLLMRYSLGGGLSWERTFVGGKFDIADAAAAAGGELLLAGLGLKSKPVHTALGEPFYGDAMLLRVGLAGRLKRSYYFGGEGTDDERANAVAVASDGTVYLGGAAKAETFLGKRTEPHGDAFLMRLTLP